MSRQCKLNKKDFINLAQCPLKQEQYIEILIEAGIIDNDDILEEENKNNEIFQYYQLKNKTEIIKFLNTNSNLFDALIGSYAVIYSQIVPSSLVLELVNSTSSGKSTLTLSICSKLD